MAAHLLNYSTWVPSVVFVLLVALVACVIVLRPFKHDTIDTRKRLSRELAEKIMAEVVEDYEYVPVDAANIAGLRQDELQGHTATLEGLGFRRLADFSLLESGATTPHSFERCMVNERLRCFGNLMATKKILAASGPLLVGFGSYLEEGWTIGSGSCPGLRTRYLRRTAKHLVQCEGEASLEQLFKAHVALRERVTNDLGISILEDISLEGCRQRIRQQMKDATEAFLNRDILGERAEAERVAREGRWEWLGGYPEEAAKRAKGAPLRSLPELSPTFKVPQPDAIERIRPPDDVAPKEKPDE